MADVELSTLIPTLLQPAWAADDAAAAATDAAAIAAATAALNAHAALASHSDARTPTGAAGGDLAGTYPSPTIPLLRDVRTWVTPSLPISGSLTTTSQRTYAVYVGFVASGTAINHVRFRHVTAAAGTGQAEVALASSPLPPDGNLQTLTVLAAGLTQDLLTGAGATKRNATPFAHTLATHTHLWALFRAQYVTTQPTLFALTTTYDFQAFTVANKSTQTALAAPSTISAMVDSSAIGSPHLMVTSF